MTGIEITLLVIGIIILLASFIFSAKMDEAEDAKKAELTEKQREAIKNQIITVFDEQMEDIKEKTEIELDKLSNIKMNEMNEYSENILNEINRKFAEVVLDGSDDEVIIAFGNGYPHLFRISVNGVKETRVNVICTHFLSNRKANSDYSKNMIYTFNDHILINHMDITTVAEFKAWLQANPITVQYELAEPITETIEPVDIVTYDNVTYLTASDNADMEVTYATDTKSYIDSKFAELHAALVNML